MALQEVPTTPGDAAAAATFERLLQSLEGRFLFLGGIYQAHSVSEDEVVFPALERKHTTLAHVAKAYSLDHAEETELFAELAAIIHDLQQAVRLPPLRSASL